MFCWTWGTWPDPVVDFGREIYVPWRLSEGDVLYRDIVSYFNGPLSPYVHALVFTIFGVSLRTLVIFNILVVAGIVILLHELIRRVAGMIAATTCCIAFLTVFAFSQYTITGNYNYICPYSYELSHGIALSLATILCLDNWFRARRDRWLIAMGSLLGFVFLTKAEVFLAAMLAVFAGVAARGWWDRTLPVRSLLIVLPTMIVAPAIALALLSIQMPVAVALRGILGAWMWITDRSLMSMPYFRQMSGMDDPAGNIATMLRVAGVYAIVLAPALAAGLLWRRSTGRGIFALVTLLYALLVGWLLWRRLDWYYCARPLPIVILMLGSISLARLMRRNSTPALLLTVVLVIFAGVLLAKIRLNVNIVHYGFALAMPASMLAIAAMVGWLPDWIDRRGGSGIVLRSAALGVVAVLIAAHLHWCWMLFALKTEVVAAGTADAFRSDPRGKVINAVLDHLRDSSDPHATLVAAPEGLFLNYLARRVNPTGQLNFTPPALVMYGEAAMLEAFERNPPELIALVSTDSSEYGARYFGRDYAQQLGAWIRDNYEPIKPFVIPLDQRTIFAIELLGRRHIRAP